jgi:penicillin-insensitive murein DD-endopeptidase
MMRAISFRWATCVMGCLLSSGLCFGCAELGVIDDGTTVSRGPANNGHILASQKLPDKGEGYVVHETWRARGLRFGTIEMIDLLVEISRRMKPLKGSPLAIGDLSFPGGRDASPHHRSHQNGRDVDLLLYMVDGNGRTLPALEMLILEDDGRVSVGRAKQSSLDSGVHQAALEAGARLDVARTWQLVKVLISARATEVQWIFLAEPLIKLVLEHAKSSGEPDDLIARARAMMMQPSPKAPHNDHMHVRIFCSQDDLAKGCAEVEGSSAVKRGVNQPPWHLDALAKLQRAVGTL